MDLAAYTPIVRDLTKLVSDLEAKRIARDDVMLTFVESYGLIAVQNPGVDQVLDAGTSELAAAGFTARWRSRCRRS